MTELTETLNTVRAARVEMLTAVEELKRTDLRPSCRTREGRRQMQRNVAAMDGQLTSFRELAGTAAELVTLVEQGRACIADALFQTRQKSK